jgi:hypothetical protein
VSSGIDEDKAKLILASGPVLWAMTIGAMYDRFFRQYAKTA